MKYPVCNPGFTIHIKCLSKYQCLYSNIYMKPLLRNTITLYTSVQRLIRKHIVMYTTDRSIN